MARILFVDDDRTIRMVFTMQLMRNGHAVTPAENGHEALEELKEGRYDIVITDRKMPAMDGITLLAEMRKQGYHMAAIMFSSAMPADVEAQVRHLNAHLLEKPATIQSLLELIDEAIEGNPPPSGT